MSEIDNSYQPKVGIERPGDRLYMKEEGEFKFFDADYTGATLRNFFRSNFTGTLWGLASVSLISGADVSTPPTLTPAYGYHRFKIGIVASKASIDIRQASKGDILVFDMGLAGSTASLEILQTGINSVSLFTTQGSRVSSIAFGANNDSHLRPFLKMVCSEEAKWSVVEASGGALIQAE